MSTRLTKLVDYGLIIATIIFAIYTVTSAIGWTNHGSFVTPMFILMTLLMLLSEREEKQKSA